MRSVLPLWQHDGFFHLPREDIMAIAHILKPAPEGGAAQLFLLFCDAGQSWQEMTPLGEALGIDVTAKGVEWIAGVWAAHQLEQGK